MRSSKTLARIRNNETVRMCALGHFIPSYVRHAAHFGFDCIWLDLEHRLISEREVQSLLAFAHLSDIDIMLRAPTLEKTGLYRYLEDGAAGLMIPHVSTPDKAAMLVDAVKFPPIGNRGIDGAGLDSDFLIDDYETFPDRANAETFLVVQIETPEAVANVDAIAATPGVDGMFVGPGDLGLRLKHESTGLTLESCFEQVAAAAARHGKAWGCPVSTKEELQKRRSQGGQLLAHGGEFRTLMDMLEKCAAAFD
ncbi:MAG: aldolase/citrate lyase family protein [Planctomycetota bacterium]|nr:aldolase/citrate lyase family protein [Planctomycetota bacterium]MDA0919143.1 aldolase/citrate lyase family protein [Planctomycetota bacterium]